MSALKPPPAPGNNEQRLEALRRYGILDTPPEEAFDGIARVAAYVCRAPIAVINFIDEGRQWFKSEIGLGVREKPLDISICAYAILQPGLLIVPDTTQDRRFARNPLVVGKPHLRFYAGAPLETRDGLALGTLCVLDYKPRGLDEAQKDALRTLSRQVMAQVELRRELADQARLQEELRRGRDAAERANHALSESERRHRAILERITDAFFALDRDWRFTYVNRQAEALLGRTRDDLLDKNLWEEYGPAVGTEFDRSYRRAMDEGVTVTFEAFYPPHDRWYEVHAYPSTDGLSVYFRDVTGRKRAEQENGRLMAASEQQRRIYETALSNTPDFNYIFDLEGRFSYINAALLNLWQKGLDEAVGRDFFDLGYPPELAARLQRQIRQVIETGRPLRDETPYTSHLGERQYEYIFVPVLGSGGAVEAVAGSTRDITERRRHEEALRAAKEEAEDANRAKDDFLAVLSHELRTPLNPILLATTAMIDRPMPSEEFGPTLEMIRQNVNLQARLIDDLLDVMRIVRGKMPLHWGVADCHDLIGRAVEITRSEALGKGHHLALDLAADSHCVNADAARLQQVFWNLIKNAVKFTPEGGAITIRTRNEGESILIEVADTGIGIDPEILPHVFDAFQQGDARITRKFGGLGLGLAICRGVVEAHGGTIAAESPGPGPGDDFPHRPEDDARARRHAGLRG